MKQIGVLSLQGGFQRHIDILTRLGASPMGVRHSEELEQCSSLIIPGGESTTIAMIMKRRGLHNQISRRIREGMPVFGTCAGMILLSRHIDGRSEHSFAALDASILRNAYGSQVHSFEAEIDIQDEDMSISNFPAVFIRAPKIEELGPEVKVLAEFNSAPVLVRQGKVLASSFHPELTDDGRIHEYFMRMTEET